MRVTDGLRMQELLRGLQTRSGTLSSLYGKLSTQKEVQKPSDDPVKTGTIMRTTTHLRELEQTSLSISAAQSFAAAASDAMNAAGENMVNAKTLALQAANGTLSPENRRSVAEQLNQVIETMGEFANTRFEGRYVFSGTRTDTAPLAFERDERGQITAVTYQGALNHLEFPIGSDRRVAVSLNGQETFVDSGVMTSLISLRDHLQNAGGLSEAELSAAIQADLGAVNAAYEGLLAETGKFGSRTAELDAIKQQTDSAVTRAQEVLSEANDVDMAQLAVDLQREEAIYQALLAAGSKVMKTSLMDYL